MSSTQKHLRNTFLAGIFGAIPLVITAFIIWWIENGTRPVARWVMRHVFGRDQNIPFLGVLLAIAAIYVVGLVTTSLLGRYVLGVIDITLLRLPLVGQIYRAWKQIAVTPGGTEGVFSKVALIPDETGHTLMVGFTSGRPVEGAENVLCVFVPAAPNPVTGRIYLVRRETCQIVNLTTEEAFKVILSTGNYVPLEMGTAAASYFENTERHASMPAKPVDQINV